MASLQVLARGMVGAMAIGVPLAMVGCGGDPPPSTRPDAFVAAMIDAGTLDTGGGGGGTDAGRDGGGSRMCRSPMGTCDLLAQDCMMGQTCVYALPTMGATEPESVCAPIVGAGAEEGGACCALNSCDTGLVCVGAVETMPGTCTSMGVCRRYCCGSSADCAPGELCNRFGTDFNGGICDTSDDCSLVEQMGCAAGEGCYPDDGGTVQCVRPTAAMAAEGATCMFTNDCVPGTGCFTVTSGGMDRSICLRFCDVGDGMADCSGGATCQAAGDLPAGVGICPPGA